MNCTIPAAFFRPFPRPRTASVNWAVHHCSVGARGSKLPAFSGQNSVVWRPDFTFRQLAHNPVAMDQPMISVSQWGLRSAAALLLSCFLWFTALPANSQQVLTYHNNNARTGLNSRETILTPANVNSTLSARCSPSLSTARSMRSLYTYLRFRYREAGIII